jgi:hypothetical protein
MGDDGRLSSLTLLTARIRTRRGRSNVHPGSWPITCNEVVTHCHTIDREKLKVQVSLSGCATVP